MDVYKERVYVGEMYHYITLANVAVEKASLPTHNSFNVKIHDVALLSLSYGVSIPTTTMTDGESTKERITSTVPSYTRAPDILDVVHYQSVLTTITNDIQNTVHGKLVLDKVKIWCDAFIKIVNETKDITLVNPLT